VAKTLKPTTKRVKKAFFARIAADPAFENTLKNHLWYLRPALLSYYNLLYKRLNDDGSADREPLAIILADL